MYIKYHSFGLLNIVNWLGYLISGKYLWWAFQTLLYKLNDFKLKLYLYKTCLAKGKAEGKLEPVRVKPAGERLRQLVKAIVEECEKDKPNVFLKDNCPNMVSNFNSMHNYLLRIVTSNTV